MKYYRTYFETGIDILTALKDYGEMYSANIIASTRVSSNNLNKILNLLISLYYADYTTEEIFKNRRLKKYKITPKGLSFLKEHGDEFVKWSQKYHEMVNKERKQ